MAKRPTRNSPVDASRDNYKEPSSYLTLGTTYTCSLAKSYLPSCWFVGLRRYAILVRVFALALFSRPISGADSYEPGVPYQIDG
jgi:hypothetical protein